VDRTFDYSRSGSAEFNLLNTVSLSSQAAEKVTAEVRVTDVELRSFKTLDRLGLKQMLWTLRKPNSPIWLEIDDRQLVDECYYAKRFNARFKRDGKSLTRVELKEVVKPTVNASVKLEWSDEETLEVVNSGEAPFGVRGFKISGPG
jgi:hypothetical protein